MQVDCVLLSNTAVSISSCGQVLSIQPGCGYLQPKQSVACKFSFCSHLAPAIYDLELVCRVSKSGAVCVCVCVWCVCVCVCVCVHVRVCVCEACVCV